MTASRRVLIAGGAGLVGEHLTRRLRETGAAVRILDVEAPRWSDDPDHVVGDVRDPATVERALDDVDTVVHAAFASPAAGAETIHAVNVAGTRVLLDAGARAGVRRVVLVSSTIVTRRLAPHPLLTGAPLSRLAAYAASRRAAELLATRATEAGLPVAVARPKTLLGPGRLGVFALQFDALRYGRPVTVLGAGTNRYQLLDVRDFATGLALLVASTAHGVFGFGADEYGTVRSDLGALVDHAASGSRLRFVPSPLAAAGLRGLELVGLPPASEWHQLSARGRDSVIDTARTRSELGWKPQHSNVGALTDAYDWFVARMAASGRVATPHPVPRSHRAIAALAGRWSGDRSRPV